MLKRVEILVGLLHLLNFANSKIISTTSGDILGRTINVLGEEVDVYLGIPYAVPPLGELRFKPSIPVNPWDGVYNATQNPPSCMQKPCPDNCSEDCLYLNIWVPNVRSDSVMVWFYGGGFMVGSINEDIYNGSVISTIGGVIVASINYRVGPFGFLCSETDDARGNMGMKDQVLGLRWIKDNIRAFGGNSSKITIFGESAGAISVSTHLVSPLTKDLFKSAIMQSGSAYNPNIIRNSSLTKWRSTKLAVKIGCANKNQDIGSDPKVMICMREQDASSLLTAESAVAKSIVFGENNPWLSVFTPIYGDDYLPVPPIQVMAAGNIHVNTLMIGTVTDEGSMFLLKFAAPLREELSDHPITNKSQAASYIRTMFRGLDNIPAESVVDYYLAHASFLDNTLLKRVYDSVGDSLFICPSVFLSDSSSNNEKNVYHYVFSHRWSKSLYKEWMGVVHGDELQFVFGLPFRNESSYTSEEKEFSKELIGVWTSFAKEGKPIYTKLSGEWPLYNNGSRLAVDLNPYNVSYINPYKDACRFWKVRNYSDRHLLR